MKLIVAVDEQWGIGKNGDLLLSIPDDMRFFREQTRGKVLLMGYNTLLSFPGSKPLPGRLNIVLADIEGLSVPGTAVCSSIEQLLELAGGFCGDDVFVIGGGSVYRQMLPYCDAALITKMRFRGEADTFIPNLDELSNWHIESASERFDYDGIGYSFVTYRNDSPLKTDFEARSSDMSRYFKKREPLTLTLADSDSPDDREMLGKKVRAYFRPIPDGFSAQQTEAFLKSGEPSFEAYLKERGDLVDAEGINILSRKNNNDPTAVKVCLTKEDVIAFLNCLYAPAAEIKSAFPTE